MQKSWQIGPYPKQEWLPLSREVEKDCACSTYRQAEYISYSTAELEAVKQFIEARGGLLLFGNPARTAREAKSRSAEFPGLRNRQGWPGSFRGWADSCSIRGAVWNE
jgi:hypothetical protein